MLDGFVNDKWFEMLEMFSYTHMLMYKDKWKQAYLDGWRSSSDKGLVEDKFPTDVLIIWNEKNVS